MKHETGRETPVSGAPAERPENRFVGSV